MVKILCYINSDRSENFTSQTFLVAGVQSKKFVRLVGKHSIRFISHFGTDKANQLRNQQRLIMRLNCGTSFEYHSPANFLKSQWQTREKSVVYLVYRWIIAGFYIFSVIVNVATSVQRQALHVYYIYLTHWNLCFTTVAMVFNACLVTLHHMDRLKVKDRMTRELKIFWFLSTTSNMYAFLVSLIYWALLYKPETSLIDLNNIVIHASNALVILIDLAVVHRPERIGMFIYPLNCGFLFLFFTWLYPFLGGQNR